jgi:hypothetical protein
MERNIIRGWYKQYIDKFGLEGWDETHPQYKPDNNIINSLTVKADRAAASEPESRATALETLQHEIYPGAVRRIRDKFAAGSLSAVEREAVRYAHRNRTDAERRSRAERPLFVASYTSLRFDGIGPKPFTKVRSYPPKTTSDELRDQAAKQNVYMSERNQRLAVVAPIQPNSGLHLLGRTNVKYGMRPTKVAPSAELPTTHANQYFEAGDAAYDPTRLIVQPGKESYLADLTSTLGQPPKYCATEREVDKAIAKYSSGLGLTRVLDDRRWQAIGGTKTNGKAAAGLVLEPVGHTRGQCAHAIDELGGYVTNLTKQQVVPGAGLWQLGGRGKRTTPEAGKDLRSRAVIFNDGINATVSSTISQGIGASIKASHGAIKIGHRAMGGAKSDARESEKNDVEFEIDHKRFGFRLAEPLLVTAFGMIRALLPPGLEWDYRVLHEMAHCIIKTIILPGGWIYRCTFGNWSGPWTSILDSLCNWIAVTSTLNRLKFKPTDIDLWIYGDDTLIGFRNGSLPRGLTPPDVQALLDARFGIWAGDWNIGKLSSYGNEPGSTFLGCWNRDGKHGRPLSKWVDISLYPEKVRPGIQFQIKRMRYLTHAAVCTQDNEDYFTDYFMWLNAQLPTDQAHPPEKLRQSLKRTFTQAHANFSQGATDTREWEAGAVTTLTELKRPCRKFQVGLFRRELTGRSALPREYRKTAWLQYKIEGVPVGVCGVKKEDVSRVLREAPAAIL